MERRNQERDSSEDDNRIRTGKFVDIPENVEISMDYMCGGR